MRAVPFVLVAVVLLSGTSLAASQAPSATHALCAQSLDPVSMDFGAQAGCAAFAECDPFSDISCSTTGGTTECSSADRNCFGFVKQRGFVTCGSSTTYCGGQCCGDDGVCEYSYGCGCSDPDCCELPQCEDAPGCVPPPPPTCEICSSITNCTSNKQCSADCPGSICTASGICLCAG